MGKTSIVGFALLACFFGVPIYWLGKKGYRIPDLIIGSTDAANNSVQYAEASGSEADDVALPSLPSESNATALSLVGRPDLTAASPSVWKAEPHKAFHSVGRSVRTITFWSMDSHPGPIQDLRIIFARILKPAFEMRWFEYDFSAMCGLTDSCVTSTKMQSVLDHRAIWTGSSRHVAKFYEAYKDDPDIQKVDAFVISMPPTVIRFLVPFSKPILCHFSIPFHGIGKRTILRLLGNSSNVVAVNNGLLQKFGSSFLGETLPLVPNLCFYMGARYRGRSVVGSPKKILVMRRPWPPKSYDADILNSVARKMAVAITFVAYPVGMKWKSLSEDYSAVALFPYTVSVMVFYETYNVNMPMFLPSIKLAKVNERQNKGDSRNFWVKKMILPLKAKTDKDLHDWYSSADFYNGVYPHLFYFDSVPHLLTLLNEATHDSLMATSKKMAKQTEILYNRSMQFWGDVLGNLTHARNR